MPKKIKPENVDIRTYQVGFGDCFLLTFQYDSYDRHMLIDFGSMKRPPGAPKDYMLKIARQIKADCDGSLDIVVATHRHKDHISGFRTNKSGTAPGNVIAACNPGIIIQPWTENPRAATDAKKADMTAVRGFTDTLNNMHSVAEAAVRAAKTLRSADTREVVKQLRFLGQDNIKNRSAVENLMKMGKNYYVNHGDKPPLSRVLPGVKVHVLGPPSLEQSGEIAKQRHRDAEEFWHLQALAGGRIGNDGRVLFPDVANRQAPIYARWFRDRLRNVRAEMMLSIVRSLDDQMNNTSLILLLEVNGKFLLFPGDAQIENWRYALDQKAVAKLLRKVTVYKVGHHGSLNATPKTLWNLFDKKGPAGRSGRLKSILSTLEGPHGSEASGTEVPRKKLVKALRKETDFLNTQSYEVSEISHLVRIKV